MAASFLLLGIPSVMAHMSMQFPHPRDNGGSYLPWQANEPMVAARPAICHGLASDTTVRDGNKFTAGDTININLYGSASHNGGHCTFWYSTDDVTFTKIIDIKDCTLNGAQVVLPTSMPTACTTKCTFAFTWVPRSSGACEIYMNCADIQVTGALGGNSNPITKNFKTSFMDKADSEYGCLRVDDTTHWTTIFDPRKETYDDSDIGTGGSQDVSNGETVGADETYVDTTCWVSKDLAINLKKGVSPDNQGVCGVDTYRCDTGQCCSTSGYCGPEKRGDNGYVDWSSSSNGDVFYANDADAFAAYCTNAVGDWRVRACAPGEKGNTLLDDSAAFSLSGAFGLVVSIVAFVNI